MEHKYKSHTIVITSWASLDRNGYTPEVRIAKKAPIIFQTLKLNKAFPTKEEAENFALEVAKKWIDDSNPDHAQASIQSTVPLTQNQKRLRAKDRFTVPCIFLRRSVSCASDRGRSMAICM
jgi:predicted negative regulator of RcsB-dependent stress response